MRKIVHFKNCINCKKMVDNKCLESLETAHRIAEGEKFEIIEKCEKIDPKRKVYDSKREELEEAKKRIYGENS